MSRECENCIACCVYLNIDSEEFKKPQLRHCPHLNLTNPVEKNVLQYSTDEPCPCSLFGTDERYPICHDYKCAWLKGYGADQDRPDRSGILADHARGVKNAIECKPLWEDAADTEDGIATCLRLSRSSDCVALVMEFGEHRLLQVLGRPL